MTLRKSCEARNLCCGTVSWARKVIKMGKVQNKAKAPNMKKKYLTADIVAQEINSTIKF